MFVWHNFLLNPQEASSIGMPGVMVCHDYLRGRNFIVNPNPLGCVQNRIEIGGFSEDC